MRLNRLDLTRYGKFTDHSIDFGPKRAGQPDLHIVYGPNEAGKSTSLAAFLDLLFGIELRSRYDFLHSYQTMQIGAELDIDGVPQDLVRLKRAQNSLIGPDGQPVPDRLLLGELGAIDRAAYRTMFSLDDETLEAGGDSILASQGDLGQLLFSASSGLADLSQTLTELQGEADRFYKPGGRSGELAKLKERLAGLKTRREAIDTLASAFARLAAARDVSKAQYDAAMADKQALQARIDAIQRRLQALPRLAAWRKIRAELAPLAGLRDAPRSWARELPALQSREIEGATRLEAIAGEITRLSAEIEALPIDAAALDAAGPMERLGGARARHVTADKDLPERRLRLRQFEGEIRALLRRLGEEDAADPQALLLGPAVIGALQALMERRSGIETALRSARDEAAAAELRLAEAEERCAGAEGGAGGASPVALAGLAEALAALRRSDHAARLRTADKARSQLADRLAEELRRLRPWRGTVETLADMAVPDAGTLGGWKTGETKALKEIDRRQDEVQRLDDETRRLRSEIDAIGRIAGVVDDPSAAALRGAREAAWATHRRALDPASADAFEGLLRRDDLATQARMAHAQEVAKLHQLALALTIADADFDAAQHRLAAAKAGLVALRACIAAAVQATGADLPEDLPPATFETWLLARARALETHAALRAQDRDHAEAEAEGARLRAVLREALAEFGAAPDAGTGSDKLALYAQALLDRHGEQKRLFETAEERRRELKRRKTALDAAANADAEWTRDWTRCAASSWIGRGRPVPAPAEVREILKLLGDLGPKLQEHSGLVDRISKMEQDQKIFAEELGAIADGLGLTTDDGRIEGLDAAVRARIDEARACARRRTEALRRREEAEARRRSLVEELAILERHKAVMTGHFGVADLAEVETLLRELERRTELVRREAEEERETLAALDVADMAQAQTMLEAADRAALAAELATLKDRWAEGDRRAQDLFAAQAKARDALEAVGGDDEVARIEEQRRTLLLEIEDQAWRALRLRAGIAAAELALRLYRDRHRSSMMLRASDAFRTISRGAYRGLASQPDKDNEILIGLGADGRSRAAADMSKGTRFQLYLALRVAGYHEFARSRRPVPFIADDIMETFDDFRAEEAFRLFADMAEVGQVIYLTHHRHLCDIAEKVCPGVKIHRLPVEKR